MSGSRAERSPSTAGAQARWPQGEAPVHLDTIGAADEALWQELTAAADASNLDVAAFASAWLPLQCAMMPGVQFGIVAIAGPDGTADIVATHPSRSDARERLSDVLAEALEEGRGVVHRDADDPAAPVEIAYPLVIGARTRGAVSVELAAAGLPRLQATMRQLQWGVAWLRERLLKGLNLDADHARARLETVLDLIAAGLDQESFKDACRMAVTRLALKLGCERVGIGFVRRGYAHVVAVSHSAEFGKQMNLVRKLGEAMDEALDQRTVILFPPAAGDPHITRAHAALAESHGCGAILTTPLFVKDRFVGAVTFERPADRPFGAEEIATAECIASVIGAVLDDKRLNDRWLVTKAADALGAQLGRLFGPGHLVRKSVLVGLLLLAAFAYFAKGAYRVVADAGVEGEVQRAIVAPYNGFIRTAPVRAGDRVADGQVLATLDDRDLALQRLRWVTERQRKLYEYEKALGERNRAEAKITQTEAEQAEAQINLIDEQMVRAKLYAPFDGLVVSGDLSQAIGGAVQRGQLLFEIAPLDRYRILLDVDESQIGDVRVGERGELVVTSLPSEAFGFKVSKITPVARAKEGRNFFQVEAQLDSVPPQIRPGMRGVGKIDVDERRLVWIWTRSFMSWLKISLWRWGG